MLTATLRLRTIGGRNRARTCGLLGVIQALSQLSYSPLLVVSEGGLEPPRVCPYAPQAYASAGSATPTLVGAEGGTRTLTSAQPMAP